MKKALVFALTVALVMGLTLPAFAAPIGGIIGPCDMAVVQDCALYQVRCATLNVRKDPSTANAPIAKVHRGDELKVVSIIDGWAKVLWADGFAYVSADYIGLVAGIPQLPILPPSDSQPGQVIGEVIPLPSIKVFTAQVDKPLPPEGTGETGDPAKDITRSTITVSDSDIPAGRTIKKVTVTVNVTHSFIGDLIITLRAPDGSEVLLKKKVEGGNGKNMVNTIFDDDASNTISADGVKPPFTGSFKPSSSLSALNGKTPQGEWALSINDNWRDNDGTFDSWSLTIEYDK